MTLLTSNAELIAATHPNTQLRSIPGVMRDKVCDFACYDWTDHYPCFMTTLYWMNAGKLPFKDGQDPGTN